MGQPDVYKRAAGYGMPGAVSRRHGPDRLLRAPSARRWTARDRAAARPWWKPNAIASSRTRPTTTTAPIARARRSRRAAETIRSRASSGSCSSTAILTAERAEALKRSVLEETNEATDRAEAMAYPAAPTSTTGSMPRAGSPWTAPGATNVRRQRMARTDTANEHARASRTAATSSCGRSFATCCCSGSSTTAAFNSTAKARCRLRSAARDTKPCRPERRWRSIAAATSSRPYYRDLGLCLGIGLSPVRDHALDLRTRRRPQRRPPVPEPLLVEERRLDVVLVDSGGASSRTRSARRTP